MIIQGIILYGVEFLTVLDQDGRGFAQILSRTFLFISWRSSALDPQETNTHNFHRQSIELGISNWKTDASIIQIAFFTSDINVKLFFSISNKPQGVFRTVKLNHWRQFSSLSFIKKSCYLNKSWLKVLHLINENWFPLIRFQL